jgi:Tfp pilus assembly protein PilN
MIRINLLATERAAKKKGVGLSLAGQKLTVACSMVLVVAVLGIGWRFYMLRRDSARLDADIAAAQQETKRLASIIEQVKQFEERSAQLQQRVMLIEQLRQEQRGPVHLLDQVSRSLPAMVWLHELKQNEKVPGEVIIDGRSTTQTGVSDFVSNLEATGFFKKSIDIVSTIAEPLNQPPGELVRFTIRAQFQTQRAEAKPAATTASAPAGARSGGN